MLDTGLDNELLADDSGLGNEVASAASNNAFQGETYQDVLDWYANTGFGDRDTTPTQYPNVVGSSYVTGEDGKYYSESGEKVYWFDPPSELGRGGQSSKSDADNAGFYTQSQIKEYWDADQGMGYFKQANPNLTYEAYMGYLSERQALVESGEIAKLDGDELYRQGHKGRGPNSDAINAIIEDERLRVNGQNTQMTSDLANKYGIQQVYQNGDGDVFSFNGSNYHKVFKVDDHDWSEVIGNIVVDLAFQAIGAEAATALIAKAVSASGKTLTQLIHSIPGTNIQMAKTLAGALGNPYLITAGSAAATVNEWREMADEILNSSEWRNVIVNFDSNNPDRTPNKPYQGDGEGVDMGDGTTRYDVIIFLPDIPSLKSWVLLSIKKPALSMPLIQVLGALEQSCQILLVNPVAVVAVALVAQPQIALAHRLPRRLMRQPLSGEHTKISLKQTALLALR